MATKPRRSHLLNQEIRHPKIRLIDENGEMQGVVAVQDAQNRADDAGLDLVLVSSPEDEVPVVKIMDYGKFSFEQEKKKREAKKNQKIVNIKEVQLKLTTDTHDLDVKIRSARKFLQAGDRVKVVIRFRGREMAFTHQGYDVMAKFAEALSEDGTVEKRPVAEGRNMIMFLSPNKEKQI